MEKKLHYLCIEVEEMARYLGIELWGCTPDGSALRVAPAGSKQPTETMTRQEIVDKFLAAFVVAPYKPYSGYLEVTPRVVGRACVKGEAGGLDESTAF